MDPQLEIALDRWRLTATVGLVLWALLAAKIRRPGWIMAGALGSCIYLWAVANLPLGRLYALGVGNDRLTGLALCTPVAAGSPFHETHQVGQKSFEPFWSLLVAALSGWQPERLLRIYPWLSLGVVLALGLSLYLTTSRPGGGGAGWSRWESALATYFALLLSTNASDIAGLYHSVWSMSFLLKPNHTLALVLLPVFYSRLAGDSSWPARLLASGLSLVVGLAFVLHWAYACVALVIFVLLGRRRDPGSIRAVVAAAGLAAGVSLALLSPYLAVLLRDYRFLLWHPGAVLPSVSDYVRRATWDQAALLALGVWGARVLAGRDDRLSRLWLSTGVAAVVVWLAHLLLSPLGTAREADEIHYFVRFLTAFFAGLGAWDVLRRAVARRPRLHAWLLSGLLLATLPAALPTWWNPLTMDRYFAGSRPPVEEHVRSVTTFIRRHTPPDAVFVAGRETARWVAALGGRRVLLDHYLRPPPEAALRRRLEHDLLARGDPQTLATLRRRFGVSHVLVSEDLLRPYRFAPLGALDGRPGWRRIFHYGTTAPRALRIYALDAHAAQQGLSAGPGAAMSARPGAPPTDRR